MKNRNPAIKNFHFDDIYLLLIIGNIVVLPLGRTIIATESWQFVLGYTAGSDHSHITLGYQHRILLGIIVPHPLAYFDIHPPRQFHSQASHDRS